jgi:hypothetical protein
VRHTEDARLAARRLVDEIGELPRRRTHAWEMKHGGVAICGDRDLDRTRAASGM